MVSQPRRQLTTPITGYNPYHPWLLHWGQVDPRSVSLTSVQPQVQGQERSHVLSPAVGHETRGTCGAVSTMNGDSYGVIGVISYLSG